MKQAALKYFTDTHLTAAGLLIFFVFFIATVIWVYRKDSKELYPRMSAMPLKKDGE